MAYSNYVKDRLKDDAPQVFVILLNLIKLSI